MKIKSLTMGIIIFSLIFGGIAATIATDLWTTTTDKIPSKIKSGEFEGSYNPADIRGSYTFIDISETFEIELKILYEAFGIPLNTVGKEIQSKDLEQLYAETGVEIGNESVQIFVALYKNLPITLDGTVLPSTAVELILLENSALTAEQKEYLASHSIDIQNKGDVDSLEYLEEDSVVDEEESENVVNGSATFQKVLDTGISKEQIEEIIGANMPPTNQTVKDYCIEVGLSFSEIKEQLNTLIQ
ncbi:MAG: hypothetical protein ACYDEX_08290 [Mobilitalea sp.]